MITTIYQSLLAVGSVGLALQAILGLGHGQHDHGAAAGHGHHTGCGASHDRGGEASLLHAGRFVGNGARGRAATVPARGAGGRFRSGAWSIFAPLLALLSPLTFFSLCVGAGASGMILESRHLAPPMIVLGSIAGALLFFGLIVRPIWSLVFRFASKPSEALEGAVAKEAIAVSRFAAGKGVVQVSVDGQLVRILANLEADENGRNDVVQPGEKLLVVSVDGHANSCRVMRI